MSTPETSREPCPDRILDDLGGAFAMGAFGGSVFHFIKGIRNSSRGQRLRDGATAVRMNAQCFGGRVAAWVGLFSTLDCTMVYLRQKEDPGNSIISGALTGGLLSMRQGVLPMGGAVVFGGCMLALSEGSVIMLNRLISAQQLAPVIIDDVAPAQGGAEVGTTSSWFGGLFGVGKEEVISTAKTEVLESFDSPVPPTFDF